MNNAVLFFDTTLRDGEQSPGVSFTPTEKVQIAKLLESLGINVIEAGFPVAAEEDFNAVKSVAANIKNSTVCAFARTLERDINAATDAIQKAKHKRINLVIATSDIHLQHKLKLTQEQALEAITHHVAYAKNSVDDVEIIFEDASRTALDFLCKCTEAAINAGATTVSLPDTVGFSTPADYAAMFTNVLEHVQGADTITLGAHCHDDLGLAVANSLAAIKAGARQVEGTINGVGERAGNAALEEIAVALRIRYADTYTHSIATENITRTSRMVATLTGMPVQPNKAIVGGNAFAHASGMHQDGVLKHRETYEIMPPELVGAAGNSLPLGKLSGRKGLADKLGKLGYDLSDDQLKTVFAGFKDLASKKKDIFDDDLIALTDDALGNTEDGAYALRGMDIDWPESEGEGSKRSVCITLRTPNGVKSACATGDGPVNGAYTAIKEITNLQDVKLDDFQVKAITEGSDAQVVIMVKVISRERTYAGRATNTDILRGAVEAYLNALNRI